MKKRFIVLSLSILIVIALSFTAKYLFSKPYDTAFEVTEKQIEERILYNKISNKTEENYFSIIYSDKDREKYIEERRKPTDRDGVINELKRALLIESVLKKEKTAVTYEYAKKAADESYNLIKTDDSSLNYYESIKSAIAEFNVTEEEYLNLSYPSAKDIYNESEFSKWFVGSRYFKDNRDPELVYADEYFDKEEQIEAFLQKALKDVTVIIK